MIPAVLRSASTLHNAGHGSCITEFPKGMGRRLPVAAFLRNSGVPRGWYNALSCYLTTVLNHRCTLQFYDFSPSAPYGQEIIHNESLKLNI
ncbi:hypothetical protein GWI33_007345 [Rhynchophorus ferrugineus]|uniref:Uncharacterized protein n=1 Tax=Rhynchophorus ferrugineus TaxID=354439 RepID=A0A834MEX4_RHYFE|nr:hypothetical protein GWI33_007345 [Rhynchophorus ferrugineus]